jgi:hypothetical protein
MSEFPSVLELAREMASESSRIKSGRDAELNAERVLNRVNETQAALQKLEQAVTSARSIEAASGEVAVDLALLDDGRAGFERLSQQSSHLPSDQAFNAAKKKIGEVTGRVTRDFEDAWAEWVAREKSAVPSIKISQLDPDDQAEARGRWDSLVTTARVTSPKIADIVSFKSDLSYLHEVLDDLPELPGPVRELYERFGRRPSLTLADVTDEQIASLREAGVAAQIEMRRRGA